ncbi:MAG: prephenate dehydrogenase/arogenate dehydrogenase family protein [Acidobacteria bacterium]|nr:prephenate dehydrogenase/arogenate dehydrogenase family protein [Acidobacteriota bacterium]
MSGQIQTVTICGVGLIGGSFALGLRKAGFKGKILGVSSRQTLETAIGLGVIDEGVGKEEGIGRADVIYLAQPILRIIDFLTVVAANRQPHALVTDAGSTKVKIMERALELLPDAVVLGGHPMAGKELRGVEQAEATLFEGRPYILTASKVSLSNELAMEFVAWIEAMGARVLYMDAGQHDSTISLISHLCQMTSTALACTVLDSITSTKDLEAAGPALRDMTRVAMSSYELWRDIIETNRGPIEEAMQRMIEHLQDMKNHLDGAYIAEEFSRGAGLATSLRRATNTPIERHN